MVIRALRSETEGHTAGVDVVTGSGTAAEVDVMPEDRRAIGDAQRDIAGSPIRTEAGVAVQLVSARGAVRYSIADVVVLVAAGLRGDRVARGAGTAFGVARGVVLQVRGRRRGGRCETMM